MIAVTALLVLFTGLQLFPWAMGFGMLAGIREAERREELRRSRAGRDRWHAFARRHDRD